MQTIHDISRYPGCPSAVCVGVFDGVHLGHQSLIGKLVGDATARGLASVVVTFEP
ncbi:MAG: riboflavin biosynthesis protein RibF, partial [Bacteroidales bacterium]|nr:riboflavin biosynthesis protein RibF [Bacteroidales bacterium]